MLDVNVWVSHYLSLSRGRQGSAAGQLVRSLFAGHCRLGPVQPIISYLMLDTVQEVLIRVGLPEALAEAARNAVEASASGGVVGQAPYMVLGGGVQPMMEAEDGSVLDAAIGGRSDLLITHHIDDFAPGARAGIDADCVRVNAKERPDVPVLRHAALRDGLVIASVFAAKSWLIDRTAPPAGVLERFRTF